MHICASMNIKEMNIAAEQVCEMMDLLSNRTRLMILCQLTEGEKSVGELANAIGSREAAMSQQLSILRRERIVKPRRSGRTMFYSITHPKIGKLLDFLYANYCADAFQEKDFENDAEKN